MTHSEFKPQAYIALSNMGGIEIMLNSSVDVVYYRFNYGQDLTKEYIYDAPIEYRPEEEGEETESGFYHHNTGGEPSVFYSFSQAMQY